MKCSEKAGFLIPRPCRTESTVQCRECQKWICGNHTATLPHGGLACTSCAAAQNIGPGVQRQRIYQNYGYGSNWRGLGGYGHGAYYYTPTDYAAFDQGGMADFSLDESLHGS